MDQNAYLLLGMTRHRRGASAAHADVFGRCFDLSARSGGTRPKKRTGGADYGAGGRRCRDAVRPGLKAQGAGGEPAAARADATERLSEGKKEIIKQLDRPGSDGGRPLDGLSAERSIPRGRRLLGPWGRDRSLPPTTRKLLAEPALYGASVEECLKSGATGSLRRTVSRGRPRGQGGLSLGAVDPYRPLHDESGKLSWGRSCYFILLPILHERSNGSKSSWRMKESLATLGEPDCRP